MAISVARSAIFLTAIGEEALKGNKKAGSDEGTDDESDADDANEDGEEDEEDAKDEKDEGEDDESDA